MLFTYIAIWLYLQFIGVQNAWLAAVVLTIGFMLSTLTLLFFKRLWIRRIYKKGNLNIFVLFGTCENIFVSSVTQS